MQSRVPKARSTAPKESNYTSSSCKFIRNVLIGGTYIVTLTLILWLGFSFVTQHNMSLMAFIITYVVILSALTLIAWLYNYELRQNVKKVQQAEAALQLQKAKLEHQVQRRTEQLRKTQLDEMRQLYRFAELGQMGVTLLHDLANHLTALTLEIEGLQDSKQSKDIERARQITQYLEEIVENARVRLHGGIKRETFDIIEKIDKVVAFLRYKATDANVTIDWQSPANRLKLVGDPASICQVVAILANNAIDAYTPSQSQDNRQVLMSIHQDKKHVAIKIGDKGKGISKEGRNNLFKPFHSTKTSGMGLGLFIAKQTVETEFGGTLELNPWSKQTEFIITLPLKRQKSLS